MADDTLFSDDLLRSLVAVGHVDLLVGLPTHNHASTITDVMQAVDACFRTYFPRQRTALIHSDGGSTDGTPEMVQAGLHPSARTVTTSHGLRSTHRIAAPYRGTSGNDTVVRTILSAADLLQAGTVVLLDADVDGITPAWIAALAIPIRDHRFDFIAPIYQRAPAEGLLVTQLLRPLIGAAYSRRIQEPLAREFGCSGKFATSWASHPSAANIGPSDSMHLRVTGAALAGPFKTGQTELGPRRLVAAAPRPTLQELFPRVIASAFSMIEADVDYWQARTHAEEIPVVGQFQGGPLADELPWPDVDRLLASFAADVGSLKEILARILTPQTLAAITAAAETNEAAARFPDDLWATTVAEFLVAYHHGTLHRDHIAQALLPLYVARTGAFLAAHQTGSRETVDAACDALCVHFDQAKSFIVERWAQPAVR